MYASLHDHPGLRKDRQLIISMEEMERDIIHLIPMIREEGWSEKYFVEISAIARNKVEDRGLECIGLSYTPSAAIYEVLHDSLVTDRLTYHLSPEREREVLHAAWQMSFRSYVLLDTVLKHFGYESTNEDAYDVFVEDWITDTDFILGVNFR